MTESVDGGEVVTVENLQERRNLYCNLTLDLPKMLGKSKKYSANWWFNSDLRLKIALNKLNPSNSLQFLRSEICCLHQGNVAKHRL